MSKKGGKAKKGGKGKAAAVDEVTDELAKTVLSPRTVTGTLVSHPLSRDIKIENFSLSLHGTELVHDCTLELNYGRRYGLIGLNGCGKTSLLDCLGTRELPVPETFEMYHLRHEVEASDKTALQAVMEDLEAKRAKLEAEAEELSVRDDMEATELIEFIYERLDELDVAKAEPRAAEILWGLGFDAKMQATPTRDFSGGWRMRISLAKALFMKPTLLLLDEPTNHLDLEACVWLERYLRNWAHILLMVSHSQDFLNNVCTNIVLLRNKTLTYWTGNYDQYIKTRKELEENQMKQYNWEQDQIQQMKDYIARFGHGSAKLAAQAKSKEKTLARMQEKGLTEAVTDDKVITFRFPDPGPLSSPVCQFVGVSFGYNKEKQLFKNLDFGVDLDSRVALVGLNGAGKSTLLKLMVGDLVPTDGMVKRHQHLRWGWYHQHLAELLDADLTPLEFMFAKYPNSLPEQGMRRVLGMFGVTGKMQTQPIRIMSDGQRNRVVFAWIAFREPHILLLDEPTNHLDLETIDSLADAINEFPGGVVLVSHDFRLINQVAKEIWEVRDSGVHIWKGDIVQYKEKLAHAHDH